MALGSRFAQYFNPVLNALRTLGGSARPREVYEQIAKDMALSDEVLAEENQGGASRFENDAAWARFYLARTGYLDSSVRGVWSLTEKGRNAGFLSDETINDIIRQVQTSPSVGETIRPSEEQLERVVIEQSEKTAPLDPQTTPADAPLDYRERALSIMQALPPEGFERLCQRLLRESGFQQVRVTGRSGDGGIDGIGILQVNPFVSFKVLFQCKRFADSVGPAVVRDFRGAMMGRADKGLILTTGAFTAGAQSEAVRDGAPPIELVDGQGLVSLLEKLGLGLSPRTTYEVDERFFEEFA